MKLRKQPAAKLALVASTLALLGALFALVRSQPQLGAEASTQPPASSPAYRDFFFPGTTPTTGGTTSQAPVQPQPVVRPHTRTRAS